ASGVDVDGNPLLVLADQDVRESRVRELAQDVLADPDVLEQVARELMLACPPVRLPVVDDAHAEAAGVHLLTHQAAAPSFLRRRVDAFGFAADGFSSVVPSSFRSCLRERERRAGAAGSGSSATTRV